MGSDLPEVIILEKDIQAVLVPSATPIILPAETELRIKQALGGSITVEVYGNLARICASELDFLEGLESYSSDVKPIARESDGTIDNTVVWDLLKTCFDPEIPVDIVKLGLIYEVKVTPSTDTQYSVFILMTLTAPGCGMGPVICADVEEKIRLIPNVSDVEVELTFEPAWTQDSLSDETKLELGMML